jgi:hypothetical protein
MDERDIRPAFGRVCGFDAKLVVGHEPIEVHAQVALSNHMLSVKKMIEEELGIKFCFTDGDNVNFRALVKFELEFPEYKEGL